MMNFKTLALALVAILLLSKGCEYLIDQNKKKERQDKLAAKHKELKLEATKEQEYTKLILKDSSTLNEDELLFLIKFANSMRNIYTAFRKNEYPIIIYDLKENITVEYLTGITKESKKTWGFHNFTKNNYVITDGTLKKPYIKGKLQILKNKQELIQNSKTIQIKDKWEFAKFILDAYKKYYITRDKIVPNLYTHRKNDISTFGNGISKKIICLNNSTLYCTAFQNKIYTIEQHSFRLPADMSNLIIQDIKDERNKGKSDIRIFIDDNTEYLVKTMLFVNPITRKLIRNELLEEIEKHERKNFKLFGHPEEVNKMNILLRIYPNF